MFTQERIIDTYKRKGYLFFEKGYNNLNICAIRNKNRVANTFDDTLCILYRRPTTPVGKFEMVQFKCTVDPGSYYLKNLMDSGGAAGIKPGQYKKLWRLGYFHNYPALIQISAVEVFRDSNRDNILDYDESKTSVGNYGIFLHQHYQGVDTAKVVENSSAGCVVAEKISDFDKLISLCKLQSQSGQGDTFTFTLFDEADFTNSALDTLNSMPISANGSKRNNKGNKGHDNIPEGGDSTGHIDEVESGESTVFPS